MSLDSYLSCKDCKESLYIHNFNSTLPIKIDVDNAYKFLEKHRNHYLIYHREQDLGEEELEYKKA